MNPCVPLATRRRLQFSRPGFMSFSAISLAWRFCCSRSRCFSISGTDFIPVSPGLAGGGGAAPGVCALSRPGPPSSSSPHPATASDSLLVTGFCSSGTLVSPQPGDPEPEGN
eukprot:CAMPEP_0113950518 /NCGR_PEP_ID=MMETSP1339-20121228/81290_1 /TAXON_ID=94617 /ORGANISM="Fibrocapsa japonica" /LENGTH=111 /DNA_ID=CAMNT_0000958383 /DNA_START=22 /DNA_END=357 /DNA_ORIENTATION=+ /assembly_acc=CAM_ASM_000762